MPDEYTTLGTVRIYKRFSAWEVFVIPVHLAFAWAIWHVPAEQRAIVPLWMRFEDIAPLEAWAVGVAAITIALIIGFVVDSLWTIRIAYGALTAFWLFVSFIAWQVSPSLVGLTLYLSLVNACVIRQAVLVVQERETRR